MPTSDDVSAEPLLDGRYRLGTLVGEGGMARVYRADDVSLGRTVAVKLIRPGLEGLAVPERARSEMTVLASLNHPSLVTLFDARLVPGQPEYLVMEFVDGPTLGRRIAAGPLSEDDVAAVAAELAEALHVVHAAGVVHRDLKPSNVLFAPASLPGARPRAKLADFGIAVLLDAARVTSPGTIIGTAAYLAPEQVRGADPAPPADVYALGLVLLESLTGTRAYPHADGVGAALARLNEPPTLPDTLSSPWRDLLARMLDDDPGRRPTAAEVAVAASALLTGASVDPGTDAGPGLPVAPATAPTLAYPDKPTEVLRGPSLAASAAPGAVMTSASRRRWLPVALAAAAVALIVVVAVAVWGAGRTAAPGPAPSETVVTEPSDTDPTVTPAPAPTPTPLTEKERKEAEKAQKDAEKKAEQERKKDENKGRGKGNAD
ncbi:MAG TPA: serine/threonine protein kinase [Microbacterium sp.]|nr:serine/threonine protein kinase [Microbacterium sp.]